jgi:dextranase
MTAIEILPTRSTFSTTDPVEIEVRGTRDPVDVIVSHLGDAVFVTNTELVPREDAEGAILRLPPLAPGGYRIEVIVDGITERTAVEVTEDPRARVRYGFAVDYSPGRDLVGITDTARRLHLTDVQFYDWAYRHADLLGGGEDYLDALNQPISLRTVRDLAAAVRSVGARALGYAAVYAVGPTEWPQWKHRALLSATGESYGLGDFLFLLDPASPDWLESFTAQLERSLTEVGFDGFHLDQYGYPKRAIRADGEAVDVANSFVTLIESVRAALPTAQLVFNNVNDFPTWATASTPQDAVYIEVWAPHVTLGSLAAVVLRARSVAGGKPVVIAAYQHVYDSAPASVADITTSFTMATLFSHGATQLLAGESDRILVDPYYVRNHVVEKSTAAMLKRWYDFLVEHDEILMDPAIIDVTGSYSGDYNDDCDVSYDSAAVSGTADAGAVWRRITSVGDRLVMHLINLIGQEDDLWDAPRNIPGRMGTGTLRFRWEGGGLPRVRAADPDADGRLVDLDVAFEGTHAFVRLPEFALWQVVVIDLGETSSGTVIA